jgi:cardiolipin synthase
VNQIFRLPNAITVMRIALVPVLILVLKEEDYASGLLVFLLAGISDALDGFIAKRYNLRSRLGALLDPLADKILLVSAYVMLTVLDQIPFWLMLTVAFRDLLIIGGYLVYTSLVGSVHMRPSGLSKFNTFMQIALVVLILLEQAASLPFEPGVDALIYLVFATTVASGLHYLWTWGIMKDIEPTSPSGPRE